MKPLMLKFSAFGPYLNQQVLDFTELKNNSFFLIEASKSQVPNLKSFRTFEEAEHAYFERYKENHCR